MSVSRIIRPHVPFAVLLTAAVAHSQSVVVHEPVWRLLAQVPVIAPSGAHYNVHDQSIYVGSRLSAAAGGAIVRIDQSFATFPIVGCDRPAAVVIDPADGDIYFAEDYAGIIYRVAIGTNVRQPWVSGFHSGDDDPMGMAIAPANYSGSVVLPGDALVADHGVNGPKQVWKWNPAVAEGEVLVLPDTGAMVNPLDVGITSTAIYFVDAVSAPGRLYELLTGGGYRLISTSVPLPRVGGIAVDPWQEDLLLRTDGGVIRVDPATGATSPVVDIAPVGYSGIQAGIDISPDGRLLVLSYEGANSVYVLERAAQYSTYGIGCSGSNGIPTIDPWSARPRLCTNFVVTVSSLPVGSVTFGVFGLDPGFVSLSPFGMNGCNLLALNGQTIFLGNHPSPISVSWNFMIPCAPWADGIQFYQQVLATDPGANPLGAIVSNAGHGVISLY